MSEGHAGQPSPRPGSGRFRPGPGQTFGRFQVIATLGKGGMGEVYRARDTTLGRDVALKFLHHVDHAHVERFRREAELTAKLVHPGIVQLHGTSSVEGKPYLISELVEGAQPLDEAFRTRSLPERVRLVHAVAEALGYAHGLGVVHRDVKPDNVLVDDQGQARVSDFGLAFDESADRLTRSGALIGTPYYMAPEQVAGRRAEVGPWTDVWALGVILYQACQDRLPFAGDGLVELSAAIVDGTPSPLTGDAAGLRPVVARALAKDPRDRYPDARALAADLQAWLGGARLTGRPTWGRRALVVGALALGGAAVAAFLLGPAPPPVSATAPAPSPEASAPPPALDLDLDRIFKGDPRRRIQAAHDALLAAPDHPRAEAIRATLRELAGQIPLAVVGRRDGGQPHAVWAGDELVIAWRDGLQRFGPTGVPGPALELDLTSGFALALLGDRLIVFDEAAQQLLQVDLALTAARPWTPLPAHGAELSVSPRGDRLAVRELIGGRLWVVDAQGQATVRFEAEAGRGVFGPAWSHDGDRVILADRRPGEGELAFGERNDLVLLEVSGHGELARQSVQAVAKVLSWGPRGELALGTRLGQLLLFRAPRGALPWEGDPVRLLVPGALGAASVSTMKGVAPVIGLAWDRDGHLHGLWERSRSAPATVRAWDLSADPQPLPPRELTANAKSVHLTPSGRYLAACHSDGGVSIFLVGFPSE